MSQDGQRRAQLVVRYDFNDDVLTVLGLRYAGEMFRVVHRAKVGSKFQLTARDDGVLTLALLDANAVALADDEAEAPREHEPLTIVVDNTGS